MRQSQLFTRTQRFAPSDEVSRNAQLLIRAGFVHKEMAGVYDYLPLGLRVLNNIVRIIREEMDAVGGQEVLLTALQERALWEKTDRWDDAKVDVWFKTTLKNGGDLGLGSTHEEPVTRLMAAQVTSYRDLPRMVYQFQTKFRNETRAKSGIMRCREFIMKDMYSFAATQEDHDRMYAAVREAYTRIFRRVGLGDLTYPTFASGGIFSKYSEEFQTVSDAGEDMIYVDEASGRALNKEVLTDEVLTDLGIDRNTLIEKKAIEVGNIFTLGTRFAEPLGLRFRDEDGTERAVLMGCYGIGPGRVMGTIAETLSDDKGLVWPASVAPFPVHLVSLNQDETATALYDQLRAVGIETLYDDRDVRAGEKFADADLIGCPWRVTVGRRAAEGIVEVRNRATGEETEIATADVSSFISEHLKA